MTISSPDSPPTEVPEADWAEQAVDVDPLAEAETSRTRCPRTSAEASVRWTTPIWSSRKPWSTARTTTSAASTRSSRLKAVTYTISFAVWAIFVCSIAFAEESTLHPVFAARRTDLPALCC